MTGEYDDIIHLPHHVSVKHPPMAAIQRAAQFLPFAALTGYDAAIEETARLTDERMELAEDAVTILSDRLKILAERITERPEVTITYFLPDRRKSGGAYVTLSGAVKKVDDHKRIVIMADGTTIPMDGISEIEGAIFETLGEQ